MSPLATFCNVAVSAVFEGHVARSSVSLDWIMASGIRTLNCHVSGSLTLPSHVGVVSVCMNDVPLAASLPSDLVLGLDWLQLVHSSLGSEIILHLASGPLDLRYLPYMETESLLAKGPSSNIPMFRGDVGINWPSSSPVAWGGPGVVPAPLIGIMYA
ncbi:hypothetical protein MSAN_00503100 [Mycena sanguinolenta]|uniref:Uncharacterized protein n=1 Tax=Mycena sanguinolenta TaxID=230812 RepID=A0A8H6Z8I1_9AGAR|nr:hypothetical protein MSAN_00503100 [Mycena sanguinolenta]